MLKAYVNVGDKDQITLHAVSTDKLVAGPFHCLTAVTTFCALHGIHLIGLVDGKVPFIKSTVGVL